MAMADVIFEIGGKALMSPSDGDNETPVISIELEINRNDLDPVRTQNITSQTGKQCDCGHCFDSVYMHDRQLGQYTGLSNNWVGIQVCQTTGRYTGLSHHWACIHACQTTGPV